MPRKPSEACAPSDVVSSRQASTNPDVRRRTAPLLGLRNVLLPSSKPKEYIVYLILWRNGGLARGTLQCKVRVFWVFPQAFLENAQSGLRYVTRVSERGGDMFSVMRETLPDDALLKTYRGAVRPERWGAYADCFAVTVDRDIDLTDF